jgi:hypothetical protein
MAVVSFTNDHHYQKEYIDLPYRLYENDRQWIPPLKSDQLDHLSTVFTHNNQNGNQVNNFVFEDGGRVIGRVSAFINGKLTDPLGRPVGCLGQFECVQEYDVAKSLLSSAITWLKRDDRVKTIWGPLNFDIWHGYRLMTKGFDRQVFAGEPYNKFYYPEFFTRFGFKSVRQWQTIELNASDILKKVGKTGEDKIKYFEDHGYQFVSFQLKEFQNEMAKMYDIVISTCSDFPGFTPISRDEFVKLFMPFKQAIHSDLISFLVDPNGKPVGFTSIFLDIGQAIRSMNGKCSLIAKLKFILNRRKSDRVIFYLCGILPEERHKKIGAGIALFTWALKKVETMGFKKIVFALMSEDNKSQNYVNHYGKEMDREYRLYEYRV